MEHVSVVRDAICSKIKKKALEHFGYDKIHENVDFYCLYKNNDWAKLELYGKTVDFFHYVFSLGEEGKIYLWENIYFISNGDDEFVDDLTADETDFLMQMNKKTNVDGISYFSNNNKHILTNRLEISPYKAATDREILMQSLVKDGPAEYENYVGVDYEEGCETMFFVDRPLHFGIYLKGIIVGEVALDRKPGNSKRFNLSYYILPEHRKHGYASEAVNAVINNAFEGGLCEYRETLFSNEFSLESVCVDVIVISMNEDNVPSRNFAEKLGAHFDGVVKYKHEKHGVYFDSRYYSLVNPRVRV